LSQDLIGPPAAGVSGSIADEIGHRRGCLPHGATFRAAGRGLRGTVTALPPTTGIIEQECTVRR
jgi:hypothetical protein